MRAVKRFFTAPIPLWFVLAIQLHTFLHYHVTVNWTLLWEQIQYLPERHPIYRTALEGNMNDTEGVAELMARAHYANEARRMRLDDWTSLGANKYERLTDMRAAIAALEAEGYTIARRTKLPRFPVDNLMDVDPAGGPYVKRRTTGSLSYTYEISDGRIETSERFYLLGAAWPDDYLPPHSMYCNEVRELCVVPDIAKGT